jgi:UDP-2,3-diacylglucosamine pyrophosphatase LpxH
MATIFPLDPEVNDTFLSGEITYIWTGDVWERSFTDKTVNIDSLVDISAQVYTITANTATTIGSFPVADYATAEYTIQIKQGTDYYSSKLFLLHDGTNIRTTEYAILETTVGEIPVTISSTISGGNVLLQLSITDADTTNCEVKIVRTLVVV